MNNTQNMYNYPNMQYDERFIPSFWAPFLLGGVTGGLLAPAFYNNGNKQQNPNYQLFYVPTPNNYTLPYSTTNYFY